MASQNYADRLCTILSHGMTTLAIGIGKELGLFQVLLDADQPVSVEEIAEQLKLKKRYTQEWLSCMISAKIIEFDKETRRYYVPAENKADLDELSRCAPVALRSGYNAEVIENCFKETGPYGLKYDDNTGFFDFWGDFRSASAPSFIQDYIMPHFKQHGVYQKLESGIRVLDLACGTGTYTLALAKLFPRSTFVGIDFSDKALGMARADAEKTAVTNVEFETGNAQDLDDKWTASFDLVFVYDALHDMSSPVEALSQIKKVMKDDGIFCLLELGFHSDPADNIGDVGASFEYACSLFVCLPSSMAFPPHVGYGACWGIEAIEKTLTEQKFKITGKHQFPLLDKDVMFLCTK